jgi:hypothetical protein
MPSPLSGFQVAPWTKCLLLQRGYNIVKILGRRLESCDLALGEVFFAQQA